MGHVVGLLRGWPGRPRCGTFVIGFRSRSGDYGVAPEGDCLDLHPFPHWQRRDGDTGPGGTIRCKGVLVHRVHAWIVRHVGQIDHRLDDILQRAPGGGENRFHVPDGLPGLLDDVVGDDLPGGRIETSHSGRVHPVADDRRVAERSRGSRCVLGVREFVTGHLRVRTP